MFQRKNDLSAFINRPRPSSWQKFWECPTLFLAKFVYHWHLRRITLDRRRERKRSTLLVTVVCISDTHNRTSSLPEGDILVHAGDLSQNGSVSEVQGVLDWLNEQPHSHKIVIAGNHDICLDSNLATLEASGGGVTTARLNWGKATYLQDSSITVKVRSREISIFGSPWTPQNGNWVFQYARLMGRRQWQDTIPEGTDILVTHGPPFGHLDLGFGCDNLLQALSDLRRKPFLHVFGHIHEGYGEELAHFDSVQRPYEDIVRSRDFYYRRCNSILGARAPSGQALRRGTVLVNAAQVGGLRDNLKRSPVVVVI